MPIQSTTACRCKVCRKYRPEGCGQERFQAAQYDATCCAWCIVTHGQPMASVRGRARSVKVAA